MSYQDAPSLPGFAFPPISPMVKRLVIVNAAIYGAMLLFYLAYPPAYGLVLEALGLGARTWREFFPFLPVWQVGSYGFLHSVVPTHLLFNLLGLYFFGSMVENTVGPTRFLWAYALGVVVPGLIFLVWSLATASPVLTYGASGAVFAMICAAATFQPHARVILIVFPIPLMWLAIGIVGIDLIMGLIEWRGGTSSGTNRLIHVAGGVLGYLMVRQRWIWIDPLERVQRRRRQRQVDRKRNDEQRLDELLQKISREGIASLSRAERAFLKRYSSRH